MNLPNRLTAARLIALFPLIYCLSRESVVARWLAFLLFVAASATDCADGIIARRRSLVTVLGKFLDPLADKALVCSVLICFVEAHYAAPAAVILVLAREFVVSGVRMAAVSAGKVVSANIFGKIKTLFQMVSLSVLLLLRAAMPAAVWLPGAANAVCWVIALLTLLSGATYVWDNRAVFSERGDTQ